MEMQQMFKRLLAEQAEMMDSSREKATKQEEMLAEMDAKMDSNQKEMLASMTKFEGKNGVDYDNVEYPHRSNED
jgi:glutamate racemase